MSDTRKRSKKRYGGHAHKKQRGARELEVGAQGVLITCNMNERKCTSEAYSLLNEYGDALYGPEQDSVSEEEDEEDADVALQKEVSQMRSSARVRRFAAVDSGASNVVFIRTHGVDPEELVHHILADLHRTKRRKSRVILRMLPVSGTCRAFPEDMERFLSQFLERWFKTPHRATYQICFKARNSSHSKRDDVISSVAGLVAKMNPLNKVDLTNPELSIIIEVIKSVCCVSVVRDYTLFRKYNLQEVAKEAANQSAETPEAANQSAETPEAANQSAETAKAANQSAGPPEAANQKQEHVDGEGGGGDAASCVVSAGNGTKEAEPE